MLYTRKGDGGTSGLYGSKERLPKDATIFEALGTLDECNSLLGVCRALAAREVCGVVDVPREILKAQECIFIIQANLAGSEKHLLSTDTEALEYTIGFIEDTVGNPGAFVIPGTTPLSAYLDFARTVCRRAERAVVGLGKEYAVPSSTLTYLNRLSSLLYALARYAGSLAHVRELSPSY